MTGRLTSSPASCSFVAVNSVQLIGSMGYCRITQTGSAWVVSTLPSGVKMTRLIGVAGEGCGLQVSATGKVTFFAGRVPVAGEIVTVRIATQQRAVARLERCGECRGRGGWRGAGNGAVAGQGVEAGGAELHGLRECGAGGAEFFGEPGGGALLGPMRR